MRLRVVRFNPRGLITLLLLLLAGSALATVPATINYQGFLTNPSTGAPLNAPATAPLSITFSLYTSSTGGTPVYTETQSVVVTNGVFNVQIGSVTPLTSVPFSVPYWLGVTIGTGASAQTLSPLQPLASAPTALRAAVAESLIAVGGTGGGNTADGSGALGSNASGAQNVAVGTNALQSNSSGNNNVALGYDALQVNSSGGANIAIGGLALQSNTAGYDNIAVGYGAVATTIGNDNIGIGIDALNHVGTANKNTAIGSNALYTQSFNNAGATWDSLNTAVGYNALYANQPTATGNGFTNSAFGAYSLAANTTGYANAASGENGLVSNTTGYNNTASGQDALHYNTTGFDNTALGQSAMYNNGIGYQNTAVGMNALFNNTTGTSNVAVGWQAMFTQGFNNSNTNWSSANTAVGAQALYANQPTASTNGTNNTALGYQASKGNIVGGDNAAVGSNALLGNTTGNKNTAVGSGALYTQSFSNGGSAWDSSNTAFGYQALYGNQPTLTTNGNENVAVGGQALAGNTTGYSNTGVGFQALQSNTTAYLNTALGSYALNGVQTGNSNTAIGYKALFVAAGNNNLAVGNQAGSGLLTGDNNIYIGGYSGAGPNESNTLRIGTPTYQTATYIQGIYGATVSGGSAVFVTSSGQLGVAASSERYKSHIAAMGGATDKLFQLRPVTFTLNNDPTQAVQYGLIAEEVDKVFPELVVRNPEGRIEGLHYEELAPMLLNEIQRQGVRLRAEQDQMRALSARLDERDKEIADLRRTVSELLASLRSPAVALAH